MNIDKLKNLLEIIYIKYNKPELISPDPLEFVVKFDNTNDKEIVGLIAASLAYGRVSQILKSVGRVVEIMKPSPDVFIANASEKKIRTLLKNFKHRFNTGDDVAELILGIKRVRKKFGSLENCLLKGMAENDILPGVCLLVDELTEKKQSYLLPSPRKNSACKRLNLFLRWMVRNDAVDPGGWFKIPKSLLIIPLDTHMYKIGKLLGFTKRKQANMKTALEITNGFKKISPDDPTRYDFALTRFGIRDDMTIDELEKMI